MTEVITTLEGGVLTVLLNRPDRLNAVTPTMWQLLTEAFDRADADDAVRAVVIAGAGRGFCSGIDVGAGVESFGSGSAPGAVTRGPGGKFVLRVFECRKPVIAAIQGVAVGVGVTMTLPVDIRIAAEDARFGFVFARRGLIPEACSNWFLPRLVGIQRALEWCYTGRMVPAGEALSAGRVLEVVPPDALLARAQEIAATIAREAAPVSAALTRQMMWRMLGADHPMESHKLEARGIAALRGSADLREGVAALKERRAPQFTMRPSVDMPDFFPWWDDRVFE